MVWWFSKKKQKDKSDRDSRHQEKIILSQLALYSAASDTADVAQDVTNLLKSRLEDTILQFETTARILNDALIICEMDGTIVSFNPAAEQIFGYTADTIIGTPVLPLFKPSHNTAGNLWATINYESIASIPGVPLKEVRGVRANGEVFHIDVNHTRLDKSDHSSIMLVLVRDISELIEAKIETNAANDRYQTVFNNSFDGILILQDDKIVAANHTISNLFGYSIDTMLENPINFLFGDKSETPCRLPVGISEPIHFAREGIHSDGSKIKLLITTNKIKWNGTDACLTTIKEVFTSK